MTEEQKAAYINAQAAILNATVQGMVAENLHRVMAGERPLYDKSDFDREVNCSNCTHNDVVTLFNH